MKTVKQVLDRINEQVESLEFALKSSSEETELKLRREGALAVYKELKRYIEEDGWRA